MNAVVRQIEPGQGSAEADDQDGTVTDIRQFVTFMSGDEVFAVDMAPVQEIIRLPAVVRLPLAPRTLDGLANLRGKVLPIISLRRVFGFEERGYDDATRAVVIDLGQPLGFVVDRVASVVTVDPRQIEDTGAISSTVRSDLLSGVLKDVGGYKMVMVLDFAKLIASEFADAGKNPRGGSKVALQTETASADEEASADELQLVSFSVAEQEYAFSIESVQEIVQVPEQIMHVPHSESHVLGVMTLRNRLLPIVSLRRMFGLPNRDADDRSRIVVVSQGAGSVGVLVDSVKEVLRVARSDVDEMPGMLAKNGELADIGQICRLDSGKRLVSVLSVGSMFRHAAIKEALTKVESMTGTTQAESAEDHDSDANEDEEQVVVFRLGQAEFGVPIGSVQEIVRIAGELTHVPKAPPAVEGVINLRGAVLPVLDLRRRLGLESVERSDRQRIIVFLIDGLRTGFIVDSVAEVLKIPKSSIENSPQLSGEQNRLLARMANLEKLKRMVLLLDPAHLIERQELEALAQVAAA